MTQTILRSCRGLYADTLNPLLEGGDEYMGDHAGKVVFTYLDDADLSGNLRLRAQLLVGTAPGTGRTITFGLHSINSCRGNADKVAVSIADTAVSGSTVAFTNPAADTRHQNVSSAFTVPADGYYLLAMTLGGGPWEDSAAVLCAVQLQNLGAG